MAQTDTTVGFLSKNADELSIVKNRSKPSLAVSSSFAALKEIVNVPRRHRKFVRNAKKTTFIYPNRLAVRVVKDDLHLDLIEKFGTLYSSSANISGGLYNEEFAKSAADVIVYTPNGFFEAKPSDIYKLGKTKIKKIR